MDHRDDAATGVAIKKKKEMNYNPGECLFEKIYLKTM